MPTGTVKWFNPTKGYGFIQPQGGGKDVFVHISAVERAGLSTLNEGQTVTYEIVSNRGKEFRGKSQSLTPDAARKSRCALRGGFFVPGAPNPKFAHTVRQVRPRTSGSKGAPES